MMRNLPILLFLIVWHYTPVVSRHSISLPDTLSHHEDSIQNRNLLNAFKNGKFQGHFRYFFSSTINKDELTDYYANAVGGGLRFESAPLYNIKAVIGGFYIFNAGSSPDIIHKDPLTGADNRYELGLFDITGKSIKEINRLEEFYLEYSNRNIQFLFGRQLLNTPFINLQDGRMRPTVVEGAWLNMNISKGHKLQGGWVYNISPRSTVDWYSIDASLGINSVGKDASGKKSQYAGNTVSKGVFMANYNWLPNAAWKFQLWDIYFENVFNMALLQTDKIFTAGSGRFYTGIQAAIQTKTGHGGNTSPDLAYYTSTKPVWITGGRLGWKNSKWDYSLNFNRISDGGRYLMPREWGRDYFYSFLYRERTEGAGDVTAVSLKGNYAFNTLASLHIGAGYVSMPDTKNYYLNKYSMPSYTHFVLDYHQHLQGLMKGTEVQVLYVYKPSTGAYYGNLNSLINKVDMHLFNVVFNFRF